MAFSNLIPWNVRSFYLSLFFMVIGLSAVHVHGVEIYGTGFDSLNDNQSLAGQDGWTHEGASNCQFVAEYEGFPGQNFAFIGVLLPDGGAGSRGTVYKQVTANPVTDGKPVIRFTTAVMIGSGSSSRDGEFEWGFYNQSRARLAHIEFEAADNQIYYRTGTGGDVFSGVSFQKDVIYVLDVFINFYNNRWSATLWNIDTETPMIIVQEETFHTGSETLNLGYIGAVYDSRSPAGDDFMYFDDLVVRRLDFREAWYGYGYFLFEDEIAAVATTDADNDGSTADEEYAFGGDPTIADAHVRAMTSGVYESGGDTYGTLTFRRRVDPYLGLEYVLRESGALSGSPLWTPVLISENELGATADVMDFEIVEVRGDRKLTGEDAVGAGYLQVGIMLDE